MTIKATIEITGPADVGCAPALLTVTVTGKTTGEFAVAADEPLTGPFGAPYLAHLAGLEAGEHAYPVAVQLPASDLAAPPTVTVVEFPTLEKPINFLA